MRCAGRWSWCSVHRRAARSPPGYDLTRPATNVIGCVCAKVLLECRERSSSDIGAGGAVLSCASGGSWGVAMYAIAPLPSSSKKPTSWSAPPSIASPSVAQIVRQPSHGAESHPCRGAFSASSSRYTLGTMKEAFLCGSDFFRRGSTGSCCSAGTSMTRTFLGADDLVAVARAVARALRRAGVARRSRAGPPGRCGIVAICFCPAFSGVRLSSPGNIAFTHNLPNLTTTHTFTHTEQTPETAESITPSPGHVQAGITEGSHRIETADRRRGEAIRASFAMGALALMPNLYLKADWCCTRVLAS